MCLSLNCGPMVLMIRPFSNPAWGLLGPPWQGSALSPWHLLKQWACGRQPIGRRFLLIPVPVSTQLSLGTLELLNWRKIAFYPGRPLWLGSSLHPVHAWPQLTESPQTSGCQKKNLHFHVTMTAQINEKWKSYRCRDESHSGSPCVVMHSFLMHIHKISALKTKMLEGSFNVTESQRKEE